MTIRKRGRWRLRGLSLLAASLLLVGCEATVSHGATASPSSPHRLAQRHGPSGSPSILQAIQMATSRTGVAISLSRLYQTRDGGRNWMPVRSISNHATLFAGPQHSVLLVSMHPGPGSQLQLTTGWWRPSRRWTFQTVLLTLSIQTGDYGVHCYLRTSTAAWCLFNGGGGMQLDASQLWQTVNAGATWTPLGTAETPPGTEEYGVKGTPIWTTPEDGWIPSSVLVDETDTPSGPLLYQTTDGGAVWTAVSVPAPSFSGPPGTFALSALSAVPGGPTWVALTVATNADATATRLRVLRTPGPNAAWKPVGPALDVAGVVSVAHLFVVSPRVWWLWTGQALYRTVNAAQSWESMPLPSRLRTALHSGQVGYTANFLGWTTGWVLLQFLHRPNVLWRLTAQGWQAWAPQVLPRERGGLREARVWSVNSAGLTLRPGLHNFRSLAHTARLLGIRRQSPGHQMSWVLRSRRGRIRVSHPHGGARPQLGARRLLGATKLHHFPDSLSAKAA